MGILQGKTAFDAAGDVAWFYASAPKDFGSGVQLTTCALVRIWALGPTSVADMTRITGVKPPAVDKVVLAAG